MNSLKHSVRQFVHIILMGYLAVSTTVNADTVKTSGDLLQVLMPAATVGLLWHEQDGDGLWQFGKSELVTIGVTEALKVGVNEQRPNGNGKHSFPSQHASMTFSSAQFLQQRYGSAYGIPAYALASFTAWSRVDAKQHYWRDVVAGAAVGIGSSYYFTESKNSVVAIAPSGGKSWMVSYQQRW